MAANELLKYPRGQVAFGPGDLQQVTDAEFDATNAAKVVSTMRKNPSGVVVGNKAVSVSFNTRVDEDGPERDFFDMVDSGEPQQMRFKFPGGVVKTVNCVMASVKGSFTLEDGVLQAVTCVGYFVK